MWCDDVDQWLTDNSIKGGHRSEDALDTFNEKVGTFFLYFIYFGLTVVTYGVFLLVFVLWTRFISKPKSWYCTYIFSRFNKNQNIDSVEHKIKKVCQEVGAIIDISGGEEVCFFIDDKSDKKHGIIFTNKRLISNLIGQSHNINLFELKNVKWYAESKRWTLDIQNQHFELFSDNHNLGILANPKSELYLDFMDAVSDSITRNY